MEAFDIIAVTQGMDGRSTLLRPDLSLMIHPTDSKWSSSPSLLARQLRLRLVVAEGSEIFQ